MAQDKRVAAMRRLIVDAREIIADVADGFEWHDKSILENWLKSSQIALPEFRPTRTRVKSQPPSAIKPTTTGN